MILDASREFEGVNLGDGRLNRRVVFEAGAIQLRPQCSFPELFDDAALEAHYRMTNNERVSAEALLEPHHARSWLRSGDEARYRLVLHDTTSFAFEGTVARLGFAFDGKKSEVYGHFALAVGLSEAPVVHGVVAVGFFVLRDHRWHPVGARQNAEPLETGSDRWIYAVDATHGQAVAGRPLVHVMDREADDYRLMCRIKEVGDEFVIRAAQDRRTDDESDSVFSALEGREFVIERVVHLSRRGDRRPPNDKKRHPPREERGARLSIRAGGVLIRKPKSWAKDEGVSNLLLHLVEVVELHPPEGELAVHWRLLTTLPVSTAEEIALVVDIYRKRWLIEEYFKALKTGCAVEERQAESAEALLATIALLAPVAVRLLQIRAAGRSQPDAPATGLLDAVETAALRALVPKAKLPPNPTNAELMRAVGLAGGHLKSNGPPGWIVLGRGLRRLLAFAAGWRAAMEHMQT